MIGMDILCWANLFPSGLSATIPGITLYRKLVPFLSHSLCYTITTLHKKGDLMHRKTRFGPRIHILWGPNAEDAVLFLAIESGQICIGSSHLTGGFAGEGDLWLTILRDALS